MGDRRRLAIVGTGRIAHAHAQAIVRNPRTVLAAVFDPEVTRVRAFADRYGAAVVSADLDHMLCTRELHGVIICSPTQVHAEQSLMVLAAGIPVLVEKPFAADGQSARHVVKTGEHVGVTVMGAQIMRFMPMFTMARQLIQDGAVGRLIQGIERRLVHRTENYPWWNELPAFLVSHWGSHSMDLMTYLTADTVDSVYCAGTSVMSKFGAIDDFSLIAHHRDGFRFNSTMSFASRATVHDIVLIGERATVQFDCYRRLLVNGEVRLDLPETEMQRQAFDAQLAEFLASIDGNGAGISAGRVVLDSLAAVHAAERSTRTAQVECIDG